MSPQIPDVSAHLLQFAVLGGGHVQVRVGEAALHQEVRHQRRLVRRVLHHDPVELRNMEEGLGHTSQLGLLHQPGRGQTEVRRCLRVQEKMDRGGGGAEAK